MAPQLRPKATEKAAVSFRTKPGKGEVKVSVINIRSPFSAEMIRPANPQTNIHVKSSATVLRPQPPFSRVIRQAASEPVSSKKPQIPTMLQIGSCLNKDSVSPKTESSRHHLIGPPPGFRPLFFQRGPSHTLNECLIIRSLHHQIQSKTPDRPAAV